MKEMIEDIKVENKAAEAAAKKFKRLCNLGNIMLNTTSGEEFISLLEEIYLKAAVSPAAVSERYACIREGQNEVVRLFINMRNLKLENNND